MRRRRGFASTIDGVLRNAQFLPRVIELDHKQPERTLTFSEYLDKVVTSQRRDNGRQQLAENRTLLEGIWRRFNVEPRFVVALGHRERLRQNHGELRGGVGAGHPCL